MFRPQADVTNSELRLTNYSELKSHGLSKGGHIQFF